MPDHVHELTVTEAEAGLRLDRYLATNVPGLSRTRAQALIERGAVTLDGRPARSSAVVATGQRIALAALPGHVGANLPPAPESITVPILYEDAALLVVDKPAGLVVHPAPGHPTGTLVNALAGHLAPGLADHPGAAPERPGIVHRLDKDTSGLMVVARESASHAALAAQMKAHSTVKRYLALVEGHMAVSEGVIEAPIGRDRRQPQRMALVSIAGGGREARTRFRVLRTLRSRSMLELQLETGRTHQIRVHLAAVGHPVVGDPTYGRAQAPVPPRQFLHATHLEFAHPVTHAWLSFDSPLPADLSIFLDTWYADEPTK